MGTWGIVDEWEYECSSVYWIEGYKCVSHDMRPKMRKSKMIGMIKNGG